MVIPNFGGNIKYPEWQISKRARNAVRVSAATKRKATRARTGQTDNHESRQCRKASKHTRSASAGRALGRASAAVPFRFTGHTRAGRRRTQFWQLSHDSLTTRRGTRRQPSALISLAVGPTYLLAVISPSGCSHESQTTHPLRALAVCRTVCGTWHRGYPAVTCSQLQWS